MLRSVLLGASSGAALAVLYAVYVRVPALGPLVFVATGALVGGAVGSFTNGRVHVRGPMKWVLIGLWVALVLAASVYVVAAIALSNFE